MSDFSDAMIGGFPLHCPLGVIKEVTNKLAPGAERINVVVNNGRLTALFKKKVCSSKMTSLVAKQAVHRLGARSLCLTPAYLRHRLEY